MLFESLLYPTLIFIFTGVSTVHAANIPLEMSSIKSLLWDKMATETFEYGRLGNGRDIWLILKRNVCVLTACKIFSFDRGFLLKAVVIVYAQAVAYYQLTYATFAETPTLHQNST
ncbi:hypothetical protein AVEN_72840-1 [Araneus ventricosus]|uniref:Uncharacterized protein n=1 Tax=Araneus ventricosus TaxID=182803 RepID=A0A4Y2FBX6_ARAVE|nr:hypothetical protein AVEN_72840-1 [Araneus ventricosus]